MRNLSDNIALQTQFLPWQPISMEAIFRDMYTNVFVATDAFFLIVLS